MGLVATTWVPPGAQVPTRIVTKSSPKPILGATEGFRKKANFGNLAGVTKQPTQRQFRGFWGGHGSGYMGLAATTWVPMGAQVPVLSLNHHSNPSQGRQKGFQKSRILEILQVSLNSLLQRVNGEVLTSKDAWGGGGGDRGYLEFGPGTPAMGYGVHVQEKSCSRPGSKSTHSTQNTQTPPTPTPPKRGTRVRGDKGVKNEKFIGGSFSLLK